MQLMLSPTYSLFKTSDVKCASVVCRVTYTAFNMCIEEIKVSVAFNGRISISHVIPTHPCNFQYIRVTSPLHYLNRDERVVEHLQQSGLHRVCVNF